MNIDFLEPSESDILSVIVFVQQVHEFDPMEFIGD